MYEEMGKNLDEGVDERYVHRIDIALRCVGHISEADEAIRRALKDTDSFAHANSLAAYFEGQYLDDLLHMLRERKVAITSRKKADVIKALLGTYRLSTEDFMAYALPYGAKRVYAIRDLVRDGVFACDHELAHSDIATFNERVVSTFPLTILSDVRGHFQVSVIDEAKPLLEALSDEQWDEYARRADECAQIRDALSHVVDFYGVIGDRVAGVTSAEACGVSVESEMVTRALETDALREEVTAVEYEGHRYLMSKRMVERVTQEGEWHGRRGPVSEWLATEVKMVLEARGSRELAPLPEGYVDHGPMARWLLLCERGRDLMRLLDDNCPENVDEQTFAPRLGVALIHALQDLDPAKDDLERLVSVLVYEQDMELELSDLLHERLFELVRRLAVAVPRVPLAGATPLSAERADDVDRPEWIYDKDLSCGDDACVCHLFDEDDYAEPDTKGLRKQNEVYLDDFWYWMRDKGVSSRTASRRYRDVSTFLNSYLAFYEAEPAQAGAKHVDGYLGNYFIRRCMWSKPENIPTTAASITEFYECMAERGLVTMRDVETMKRTIKREMSVWQDKCARYNDPLSDIPFEWWEI